MRALNPFRDDVWWLVRTSPYLQLAKPTNAEPFLRRQVALAEECLPALSDYPRVLVEPLEFFYTCLRSLGALTASVIEVLVRDCNWRGVVWGAWLAILEPRQQFLPALDGVRGTWSHNDWLVDCAIAAIHDEPSSSQHEAVMELAARCRQMLRDVKRPVVQLRSAPTDAQAAQVERERKVIRDAYARGGTDAARAALSGTLLAYYLEDYGTWAARGCPNWS